MKTILDVVAELRDDDPPLDYLGPDDDVAFGRFLEFEVLSWNGVTRVAPSEALNLPGRPEERSFMYRGQTKHYPTCYSSLLRDCPDEKWNVRARLFLERIRVAELELLLQDHPFKTVADKHGYPIDYHGLAQHYGICTSLLDLTSQVEVAAFFAVASWDAASQQFLPMTVGDGVVFRLDWAAFGQGYTRAFNPVGIGPGLRPARQHAWTFNMKAGVDFQTMPHVSAVEFRHSAAASKTIFDRFDSGRWLYPPDCLASLVEKIEKLPFATANAMRHAARQDGLPDDAIEDRVRQGASLLGDVLGIDVLDGYSLQPEEEDLEAAQKQAADLDKALQGLRRGFRLVRTPKSPPTSEQ